jgi:integrase
MNLPQYKYIENYDEQQKRRYLALLPQLGSNIRFDEDTWVCDKRIRSAAEPENYMNLYFSAIPSAYKELVKYYALLRLLHGDTARTVRSRIARLVPFLKFLTEACLAPLLSDCDIRTASRLKEHLDASSLADSTIRDIWREAGTLYRTMDGFNGIPCKNPFARNPYVRTVKLDSKYIPDKVAEKLDGIFRREEIDLHIRCVYWLLRLIPSRISEVLGMAIDCVKPYNGNFVLFIPTWKQNGGNMEPILRSLHIEDTGIAGYLLDLLRAQQTAAAELQEHLPENKRGCLFTYQRVLHYKNGAASQPGRIQSVHPAVVEYHFKRICEQYGVRDENWQVYNLTSHQFRHNGITDRLEAGFTLEQIADMTGHHGNAMIWNAYSHLDLKPKTILQKQQYVLDEPKSTENPYILFGGRILNMEEMLEKRLLKNLRAHRVPGGICGDVTGCKSDMWDCLGCGHFIPNRDQFSYFEEQAAAWRSKADRFPNFPTIRANALRNAELFERITIKLLGGEKDE